MHSRIWTDALREVRRTLSRFLSLFLLSALAVAFLAGLRTTAPDMEYSADAYFDAHGLMDFRVLSTLGLTGEDVDAISAQPGVEAAQGSHTVDAIIHGADNDIIVKACSLTGGGLNLPELRAGRMPERADECLVEPALLDKAELSLGDTLALDTGEGDLADALSPAVFTVVGTADSPLYLSVERGTSSLGTGRVAAYVLLPEAAFSMDTYTEVYLRAEGAAALPCYGDGYEAQMDVLADILKPLGEVRAGLRYAEVVDEANEKLADAQKEFDDAQAETEEELADGARALSDARTELADGWKDYDDGLAAFHRETADARRQIAQAEHDLPEARADLEQGERDYADGVQKIADGWTDYHEGEQTLADGWADYREGAQTLADGQRTYDKGYWKLLEGENGYNESVDKLRDGEAEYEDGLRQYREGLLEIRANAPALMDAKKKLDDAREQLAEGEWTLAEGQGQLNQQSAAYQQMTSEYEGIYGVWSQKGLVGDTPTQTGQLVGTYLLQALAGDPSIGYATASAFVTDYLAPLQGLLLEQRSMAAAAGQDTAPLDSIIAALPADAGALLTGLGAPDTQSATVYAIVTAFYTPAAVLAQTGQSLSDAQAQLDAGAGRLWWGRSEYEDGLEAYNRGKQKFDDGVASAQKAAGQLTEARKNLDDGWWQLQTGRGTLDEGWAELDDARRELEDGRAALADAHGELLDGEDALADALARLRDGEAESADARKTLDDGWKQYEDGVAELADAKARLPGKIAKAEAELADALAKLRDGEADYADGLREYQDGKTEAEEQLSDARNKLSDARRKISEIETCKWYILGRNTNAGYVSFQQDAQRMGNLASVFPIIFFLVAALVCLTTMTRMVEEQRLQIGCLKALGYGKGAIAFKYVGYGFFASLLGGLAGLALGCTLIPMIIFNAWKILYTVGELIIPPAPLISAAALGAAVLCVTGTAFASSYAALSAAPAQLMRPKAPPAGKRVLLERAAPLWHRLSFTHKVTVRNLFRYKKRFWMTVAGIGGCTALIVTGFGLRDSIYDILDKQYDEISTYSANVGLAEDVTHDELIEITGALDRSPLVAGWMGSYQTSLSIESGRRTVDGYLFAVGDEEKLGQFIHLRHRLDGRAVTLPEEGAVLTEKLADLLEVGVGDTITLDGDDRVEVTVSDVTENYVFHYVYLSRNSYEALYGQPPPTNTLMVTYTDDTKENADAVAAGLIPLSGVTAVSRIRDSRSTFTKSMQSVDYAVILIIFCAAALAFVVLFNLTNINITERLRELATLKVLGFYDRELAAYVFRENVLLTFFGVFLGLVMGKYLHQWLVLTVEIDMVMFGRSARPMSYVYAVLLTICFSLLVNLAARRRLKKIDMVESLKTVE